MGHKRTLASELGMSALPLKADMLSVSIEVRFVPIADIGDCGGTDPDALRIRRIACAAHMSSPRIFTNQARSILLIGDVILDGVGH